MTFRGLRTDGWLARPVPAGVRPPASFDARPDGWEHPDGTFVERLSERADRFVLSSSGALARQVSRRQFLGLLAQGGLLVGIGFAGLLWGMPRAAAALPCDVYDPNFSNPGACGPSEECDAIECGSAGNCNSGHTCAGNNVAVRGQPHLSGECGTAGSWDECCPAGLFRCTDCCGCKTHGSGTCADSSCPNPEPHYKCICEKKLQDNC